MKKFLQKFRIVSNKNLHGGYFKLTIQAPQIAKIALPGQFVNIRVSENHEPLLRRPLSIHRMKNEKIELLYEVVGSATEILSQKKAGEQLDLIGPLGNGFSMLDSRCSILVAGGMGVAPLIFLAEKLAEIKNQKSKIKNLVLIGAKTKKQILCEKEFKDCGCDVKIATDDGSCGFKGYVSELLKKTLSAVDHRLSTIYACGPRPMLKEVAAISKKHKIPAQISLEEHMACGIGACFGCAIKVKTKNEKGKSSNNFAYKRVCKEGPVFLAEEIIY